jgi:hypothetical protein
MDTERCVWSREEITGCFDTSCGQAFVLNDGTLVENGMRFCCYCGKTIVEVVDALDDDDDAEGRSTG